MWLDEVSRHFTGVVLEVLPTPSFAPKKVERKVSIGDLIGPVIGLRRAVVQIVILAVALELFALAAPMFNQFVIDEVILSGDGELLKILLISFALLLLTQTALSLARSWFLMRWSMDIGLQWNVRIFTHLMRLPAVYFEKRHLGDVISRFNSTGAIQNTLTNIFAESLLDGLMALLAFLMMISYSVELTLLIVVGVILYTLLRWVFYYPFHDAAQERLELSAKENSHFIETLRAIVPLKLFRREEVRRVSWINLKIDVQNRDVKTAKIFALFRAMAITFNGIQGLGVFYMGAKLVISNELTIGMLMAFSAYAATFSTRFFNLVDIVVDAKTMGMHFERLSDIVLEKAEAIHPEISGHLLAEADLTLRNIRFKYAEGEPYILDGVNIKIPRGQNIAVVGPSGCGKTTLCKIILGILDPTEGEIMLAGVPLRHIGLSSYRELVGTVMQDDVLLAGSIKDNIAFFDPNITQSMVEECAKQAAIHDEIIAMPMGYYTLVGDMGSSLSGGQKQRILLARALYKKPKILALDEATSHLDIDNEKKVNECILSLNLTRIIIAHRKETINNAERIVSLIDGKLVEVEVVDSHHISKGDQLKHALSQV